MKYPAMPNTSIITTSNVLLCTVYAPIAQNTKMTGAMTLNGMRRMAANNGTHVKTISRPTMLPIYMLAIRPQTKSFCSVKSSGPGCNPKLSNPPRSTAAVGEPGTTKANCGRNADVSWDC